MPLDHADADIKLLDGDKVQTTEGYQALILFNDIISLIQNSRVAVNLPLNLTWAAHVERSPATFSSGIGKYFHGLPSC